MVVSPDSRWGQWESLFNIFMDTTPRVEGGEVELASDPVGGRSRVTELPCFFGRGSGVALGRKTIHFFLVK